MALKLFDINRKGLELQEETLKILEERNRPVVVIGIMGEARTGKSFLMNKLAGGQDGFKVDSGDEPVTKGVWIKIMDHPAKEEYDLILLDTEGLGDTDQEIEALPGIIFTVNYLLCSALVYNVFRSWKESALDQISCLTYLEKSEGIAPQLLVTIRDSNSKQEDDKYLEEKLNPDKGQPQLKEMKRKVIKEFPDRKCFTFFTPAADCGHITESNLTEAFRKKLRSFVECIHDIDGKSYQEGFLMTGRVMAELLKSYVMNVNQNKTLNYSKTAKEIKETMEEEKIRNYQEEAVTEYKRIMIENQNSKTGARFTVADKMGRLQAIEYFEEKAVRAKGERKYELEVMLDIERDSYKSQLGGFSYYGAAFMDNYDYVVQNKRKCAKSAAQHVIPAVLGYLIMKKNPLTK